MKASCSSCPPFSDFKIWLFNAASVIRFNLPDLSKSSSMSSTLEIRFLNMAFLVFQFGSFLPNWFPSHDAKSASKSVGIRKFLLCLTLSLMGYLPSFFALLVSKYKLMVAITNNFNFSAPSLWAWWLTFTLSKLATSCLIKSHLHQICILWGQNTPEYVTFSPILVEKPNKKRSYISL